MSLYKCYKTQFLDFGVRTTEVHLEVHKTCQDISFPETIEPKRALDLISLSPPSDARSEFIDHREHQRGNESREIDTCQNNFPWSTLKAEAYLNTRALCAEVTIILTSIHSQHPWEIPSICNPLKSSFKYSFEKHLLRSFMLGWVNINWWFYNLLFDWA